MAASAGYVQGEPRVPTKRVMGGPRLGKVGVRSPMVRTRSSSIVQAGQARWAVASNAVTYVVQRGLAVHLAQPGGQFTPEGFQGGVLRWFVRETQSTPWPAWPDVHQTSEIR